MPGPSRSQDASADRAAEDERIARYEPVQREVCAAVGAAFEAPDRDRLVWLGPGVAEGHRLVEGVRHPPTERWSGWSLIRADRPKPAPEEIRFEHLRHLVTLREDLLPYLGLPVGWTFEILADGSWHAWSPRDKLLAWLGGFLDGAEAGAGAAAAIAELAEEHFGGTELDALVVRPLQAVAAGEAAPGGIRDALERGRAWLERSAIR